MKKPELNRTEECILETINEMEFTAAEKYGLLDSYFPVISRDAWRYFVDRIIVIDRIKMSRGN